MCSQERREKKNSVSQVLKMLAGQYRFAFKEKNFELKRGKGRGLGGRNLDYLSLPLYLIQALQR